MQKTITLFALLFFGISLYGQTIEKRNEGHEGQSVKKVRKEQEKYVQLFNEKNGIRNKNRNALKLRALEDWQKSEGTTSSLYNTLNGTWTQVDQGKLQGSMGRTDCIGFHPTDANIYYLGTGGGGIWKTTDGGNSYVPLTDNIPSSGVADIVVDYTDPNIVYMLTGSGFHGQNVHSIGILKSTDAGSTWQFTGLTDTIERNNQELYGYKLMMHPTNHLALYACTNQGLYISINGGDTWRRQTTTPVYDLEFKPDNSNIVFLARDAGIIQYATHFSSDSLVVQAFSFLQIGSGQAINVVQVYQTRLAVSPVQPNLLIAVAGVQDTTIDFGVPLYAKSMTANANGTLNTSGATIAMRGQCGSKVDTIWASGLGRGYGDVIIDKTNSLNIMVAGLGFYTSSQGLSSNPVHWTRKDYNCGNNTVNFHVDVSNMYEYNGSIYVCNDGGVARQLKNFSSTNTSWTDLTQSIEITQAYAIAGSPQDINLFLYGCQDNGSNIRTSAASYTNLIGGDGTAVKIDQTNKDIYYASIQNGELLTRWNNGVSTGLVINSICMCKDTLPYSGYGEFSKCIEIDETNQSRLVLAKRNIYTSTNKGDTWTTWFTGQTDPIRLIKLSKANPSRVYFISSSNVLYRSISQGGNFSSISWPEPFLYVSDVILSKTNEDHFYITCMGNVSGKKVYFTNNAGVSWQNISSGLPNVDIRTGELDPTTGDFYVGTDLGVFVRPAGLNRWIAFNNGLPLCPVYDLYINPGFSKIAASCFGRGIFQSDLFSISDCAPYRYVFGSIGQKYNLSALDSMVVNYNLLPSVETQVKVTAENNYIRLIPGFVANATSTFQASIEPCGALPNPYKEVQKENRQDEKSGK